MQDAVHVQKSRNPLLNPGGAAIRNLEISWNRLEEFLLGARGACVSLSRTSLRQTLVHHRTSGSFDLASSTIAQYFGQELAYRLPPPLVDTSHITRCFYLFCFIYPRPKRQYLSTLSGQTLALPVHSFRYPGLGSRTSIALTSENSDLCMVQERLDR
jgi:hypothetical protein